MARSKATIVGVSALLVVAILLGLFVFVWQTEEQSTSERAPEAASTVGLGITYLPLTPGSSGYYDLGVDSGVLVTEVTSGSPAGKAGVKVGDVIVSFNGVALEEGVPLLGMMRACHAENRMVLEVWRGKSMRTIELASSER